MSRRYIPTHGYNARNYRCAMFPWLKGRNIHHTAYGGPERLWWDLLPLSLTAHWVIHGLLGGSLTMPKADTRQNRMARALPLSWLWKYPNPLQRCVHWWCRIPVVVRWLGFCLWVSYQVTLWLFAAIDAGQI